MDNNDLTTLLSGVMSNPDIMNKISGIMNDPEAMKSISNAMSGISPQTEQAKEAVSNIQRQLPEPKSDESKNRARLISALKPYLNADRRDKADKLLGLLTLLEISGSTGLFKKQ